MKLTDDPGVIAGRMLARVNFDGDCWRWTGAHSNRGYGRIAFRGINAMAHRVAYELLVGPIPEGLEIDHICGTRDCLRPDHLRAVTHRENTKNSAELRRGACKNGHPLPESFAYNAAKGTRRCRLCHNAKNRSYYHASRSTT